MLTLLELHYQTQNGLTFTNKLENEKFTIYHSSVINDIYRNFAVVSNIMSALSMLDDLRQEFHKINRKPCIYLNASESHELRDLQDNKWKIMFMDTWMRYQGDEAKMPHQAYNVQTPKQVKDFIYIFEKFYRGNIANLEQEIPEVFDKSLQKENFRHYISYDGDVPTAIASFCEYNGHCLIYNFAADTEYYDKGYRESVLGACLKRMQEINAKSLNVKISNSSNFERWFTQHGFRKTISAYGLTED